ncbi:MAG: ROK family protein, partial [Actinoplanes sp.]
RGRPTTILAPHPAGPLVLAIAITHEGWRIDVVELGGRTLDSTAGEHASLAWPTVVAAVTTAISQLRSRYGVRLRAVGISVPGPVSRDFHLDASIVGWHNVDLTALWPTLPTSGVDAPGPSPAEAPGPGGSPRVGVRTARQDVPAIPGGFVLPDGTVFVAGNDASLAAAAESARGAAAGASLAVHLRIEGGLGGAVVDCGRLLVGALGAAGEFGHMPFGDPAITCPCGAAGCWGTAVDGTALARHLGHPAPPDPVSYARRIIADAADPAARRERAAVGVVAATLGRGIAGLVNGLDPDLVTLGGVGADLLAAAPDELSTAYRAGLMQFRRATPPPVVAAALADDGPIAGAGEEAWSSLLPRLA